MPSADTMNTRLTRAETAAVLTALAQVLSGPLDGSPEPDEEIRLVALMKSAQKKLEARL
jgi:hypothetical protein